MYLSGSDAESAAHPERGAPIWRPGAVVPYAVTGIPGTRSHFFYMALDAYTIGRRLLTCLCPVCRKGKAPLDFLACENFDIVGEVVPFRSVRLDANGIRQRLERNQRQGLVLAKESSKLWLRAKGDKSLRGPLVAVAVEPTDNGGYNWRLGRITGRGKGSLKKAELSIFKYQKGGKKKKGKYIPIAKGQSVAMVKFLDRVAGMPRVFSFGEEGSKAVSGEGYINVKALRVVGIQAEEICRTRRQAQTAKKIDKVILSAETIERIDTEMWEFEKGGGRWVSNAAEGGGGGTH
jgi:hypothetical protein